MIIYNSHLAFKAGKKDINLNKCLKPIKSSSKQFICKIVRTKYNILRWVIRIKKFATRKLKTSFTKPK